MNFPAVDEIDFLPAGFFDRQRRRRARSWRWGAVAAFVALAGLGLAGNRLQHARLASVRDELAPRARAVSDLDRRTEELKSRIASLGLTADVRARLRLRPSVTRLLAAATVALPPHTSLTDLHLSEVRLADAKSEVPPVADQPPAQRDLDRLLKAEVRTVVTVRGRASDDASVSEYLSRLSKTGLFDEVRLLFTDFQDVRDQEVRSFSAELRVRASSSRQSLASPTVAARGEGGAS